MAISTREDLHKFVAGSFVDGTRTEQVMLMMQLLGRGDMAGQLMRNEVARLQLMVGCREAVLSTRWYEEFGWLGEWVGRLWVWMRTAGITVEGGDGLQAANDTRRIHLCARTYKGMRLINIKDIRYLQADQKYVTVRDEQQEVIVDETLRELEHEFADVFVRVHCNALVARKHIVGLEKGVTGQIVMRLDGVAETVDISRRHLPAVRKILKNI